jgi:hypothetical protein
MDPRQPAEPSSTQSNYRTGHRRRSPAIGPYADSSNNINPTKWRDRGSLAETNSPAPKPYHLASIDPRRAISTRPDGSVTMRSGGRTRPWYYPRGLCAHGWNTIRAQLSHCPSQNNRRFPPVHGNEAPNHENRDGRDSGSIWSFPVRR